MAQMVGIRRREKIRVISSCGVGVVVWRGLGPRALAGHETRPRTCIF